MSKIHRSRQLRPCNSFRWSSTKRDVPPAVMPPLVRTTTIWSRSQPAGASQSTWAVLAALTASGPRKTWGAVDRNKERRQWSAERVDGAETGRGRRASGQSRADLRTLSVITPASTHQTSGIRPHLDLVQDNLVDRLALDAPGSVVDGYLARAGGGRVPRRRRLLTLASRRLRFSRSGRDRTSGRGGCQRLLLGLVDVRVELDLLGCRRAVRRRRGRRVRAGGASSGSGTGRHGSNCKRDEQHLGATRER
jgi:hypothetical protein